MLVVYQTIPESELRKSAAETIKMLEAWFANNPKRKICKAELWYGRVSKIQRKDVVGQINAIVENILKERA